MGLSPRVVTEDRLIAWDGVTQRLPKGQVMDVPPDSPLERAIGAEYLVPLPGTTAPQVPVLEEAAVPAEKPQQPAPALPKPAATVKKQDSGKVSTSTKDGTS